MKIEDMIPKDIEVGVVGLGLMGSSIAVALLLAGHPVRAIAPLKGDMDNASRYIHNQLLDCARSGLLKESIEKYEARLFISEDYTQLKDCKLVLECVIERIDIKKDVYDKILKVISTDSILASNTSSIPISNLQSTISYPERFLGIHWAEPAFLTRFLEITCGHKTGFAYADWVYKLAYHWGKEPTVLKKDIRGFITNRLMYAVYRESFHLIDQGRISIEDIDKSFRYEAGSWMTLMGIFRRLDIIGLVESSKILASIFPTLCNENEIPLTMQRMININARGTQNLTGLYSYTPKEAKEWEEAFAVFNKEIYKLASFYPSPNLEKRRQLPYSIV